MLKRLAAFVAIVCILCAGCARVPKNAALLSSSVNGGITRLQAENEKVIRALGDVERGILDEKWEDIYRSAEKKYRSEMVITSSECLTEEQRLDITTIAAAAREEILAQIAAKEEELINDSRKNAQLVIGMNSKVQAYLLSLERLDASRHEISDLFNEITGVDPSLIVGTVEKALVLAP
ncbi:hypothetical protein [Desulfoferrobacter suflitae]|uniref:hypothetical protein n=1 Tax=Desulfoferrobacter suflitae TaxID=2865782 RepID=UPI0021646F03|nr:hypothetical protein [Desulfoferrobacter suflitae]MCK8600106.1 hypothetical protein [Desulfoferrobacter suflitae]